MWRTSFLSRLISCQTSSKTATVRCVKEAILRHFLACHDFSDLYFPFFLFFSFLFGLCSFSFFCVLFLSLFSLPFLVFSLLFSFVLFYSFLFLFFVFLSCCDRVLSCHLCSFLLFVSLLFMAFISFHVLSFYFLDCTFL